MIEIWGYPAGQMREFAVNFVCGGLSLCFRNIVDQYGFDQLIPITEFNYPLEEGPSKVDLFGNKQSSVYHHNFKGKLTAPFTTSLPTFAYKNLLAAVLKPGSLPKNAAAGSLMGMTLYQSAYSSIANAPDIRDCRYYSEKPSFNIYDLVVTNPSPYITKLTFERKGPKAIALPSLIHVTLVRGDQGTVNYSVTGRDGNSIISQVGAAKFGEPVVLNLSIGGYLYVSQSALFTLKPSVGCSSQIFKGARPLYSVTNGMFDFFPSAYSAISSLSTLRVNNYENLRDTLDAKGQLAMFKATFDSLSSKYGIVKAIAGTYLAYKYAVAPLLSDVSTAAEFQSTLSDNGRYKVYGSNKQIFKDCEWTLRSEVMGQYSPASVAERLLKLLDRCGLGPTVSNAWELIPFSFVLNWILPVGDILKRLDFGIVTTTYNKFNVDTCITSARTEIPWYNFSLYTGSVLEIIYIRDVSGFMPISSPTGNFNVTLGKHVVELASLFISRSK